MTKRKNSRLKNQIISTLPMSMENLQLMLFRDFCATRRPRHYASTSNFYLGVRSRAKYTISSLTIEVARISFVEHLWTI